jgi:hypothetical protein
MRYKGGISGLNSAVRESAMPDFGNHLIGVSSEILKLETSGDQNGAATALVRQARRSLDIFTSDLDRKIYDDSAFLDALQGLAVNRHGQIRILVKDSANAVKYGHRLIPLYQRLTSLIEIRKVAEDFRGYNEAFLVADGTGYARRRHTDRFEGIACFNAANEAREFLAFFNEVWRNSASDPDLQRIYL